MLDLRVDTFEEILKIAVERDVDMVLLGGDLYHDNKPSRNVLFKSMKLFKKYCMGERYSSLENLSDQDAKFHHNGETNPNYLDPNYNISLPIFSIHGNHDDPAGVTINHFMSMERTVDYVHSIF